MSAVVEARAITRRFGAFTAVDTVDLSVRAGEVVGLLGANGAGKTTVIKMLLGLLTPTSGSIRLFGEPPSLEHRRRIGYVPQNLGLYPDLTVDENLAFRAEVFGAAGHRSTAGPGIGTAPEDEGRGGDTLVGELSLGVQRRVAFTAALQHHPDLLVLDEPTSGVSPLARSELWDLIRRHADRGAAVLVSTHYMDEVVQADRLVVMAAGRTVATGSAADVIGGRTTLSVRTDRWSDAFAVLDRAGCDLILAGRTIRVPSGSARQVAELLEAADITAEISLAPATLDETMVELSR
jgi:ABC-2 type transport system ATP-binding protein/ribosome-dependent ATPase